MRSIIMFLKLYEDNYLVQHGGKMLFFGCGVGDLGLQSLGLSVVFFLE